MKNWQFFTLIGVIILSVFIHFGINYYWWDWDAENFDHIMSPLGGIISALLLCVAIWQTHRSINIANSQNLKSHFEREYVLFKERLSNPVDINYQTDNTYSALEVTDWFSYVWHQLIFNEQYRSDVADFEKGVFHDLTYYTKRSYISYTMSAILFHKFGIYAFNGLKDFIIHIEKSALSADDKVLFYRSIKQEFLFNFSSFIKNPPIVNESFLIPELWNAPDRDKIRMVKFESAGLKEQMDFFDEHLK